MDKNLFFPIYFLIHDLSCEYKCAEKFKTTFQFQTKIIEMGFPVERRIVIEIK